MPRVEREMHKDGDFLVDYEEKVFEDVQAEPGEKALVTFHTMAFEGSISIVNTLTATRLQRKGFETSILLYGPGVTMGFQRGFPTLGDEAFPGHLFVNQRLQKFMEEGGKVYGCRFSTQALYGQTEKAFIPGNNPDQPAGRAGYYSGAQEGECGHHQFVDGLRGRHERGQGGSSSDRPRFGKLLRYGCKASLKSR